ncbi:helix-turn-helix transcriptional regulator [Thiomicrorhabdus xiamenensis]|uniref:WYL domain-containing protein n=1 Tax=Thiomicrorhabdus xiamenensis TaxID=2739063 RepID=A0A7D4T8Y8_9GAMM|nr:WYL domain-containing protein [Thiomicrorhabdus xiamenensis]QKI88146.1 WYL domain-containing protein [Thiomicrorhabdus xiamenensis]
MNKSDRCQAIKVQLRNRRRPTPIEWLAMQYECSEKTIRRDIEYLNDRQQLPCYIHQNQVYLDEQRMQQLELDGYWLSADELQALFALNITIEQLSQGALAQQLEPIKNRLKKLFMDSGSANELVRKIKIVEIGQRNISTKIFNQIVDALTQCEQLEIQYWKRNVDQTGRRVVSPQQLVRYKDNWYLDAFCHRSNDIRSFSIDAIRECRSLYQKAHCIDSDTLKNHFSDSYGIFGGEAKCSAVLHFNEYISRWIQNETWHPEQIIEKQTDGSLIMHLPYQHDIELIQDILKYGANVKVIAPPELQEKVRQQLLQASELYLEE